MKNKKRIVGIVIFAIIVLIVSNVMAININTSQYDPLSSSSDTGGDFTNLMKTFISIVQVSGSAISIIALAIIAIKYMIGSVEEKAEYKKTLVPYLVGAIFVFGIVNILAFVESIVNSVV